MVSDKKTNAVPTGVSQKWHSEKPRGGSNTDSGRVDWHTAGTGSRVRTLADLEVSRRFFVAAIGGEKALRLPRMELESLEVLAQVRHGLTDR
jgi:hypothetical protein